MKEFLNSKGIPFNVRIVRRGDHYGLNDCLTHEDSRFLVEFYDARYKTEGFHPQRGQFVSRYYWDTLNDPVVPNRGIDLQGDVKDWKIDATTFEEIRCWVKAELEAGFKEIGQDGNHQSPGDDDAGEKLRPGS